MRLAVAGKGGAGKTTIAATLARLLAHDGQLVVAVDGDSNPNLAAALGLGSDLAPLPQGLVSRRLSGPALTEPVSIVVERHAVIGPEGVRVVLMGAPVHAEEGCLCSAHATVSALLADLGGLPGTTTVVDLEASPEHLSRGTARHVDIFLLVAEPYYRSLESVRRLAGLARELPIPHLAVVANKIRSSADAEAVAEFCARHDLDLVGEVPWSEAVVDADRRAIPLIEHPEATGVITALTELADHLARTVDGRLHQKAGYAHGA